MAAYLSGGQQQMLAIGRGFMSRPELLLLDEPSLGLSPVLVGEIFEIITRLNEEQNISILLVEQNANVALKVSSRGYVMEVGGMVMDDDSDKLLESERYQGVLSRQERRRRARFAALEKEEDLGDDGGERFCKERHGRRQQRSCIPR